MAEPSEGAYVLINVASQKALDVQWKNSKYQSWLVDNARHSDWICQTWIFDKQSNGWQITNYATWGCMDASDGTYAQQTKDKNTTAQRWTVDSDGNTYTYGGASYPTYTIKSKSNTSKYLVTRSDGWIGVAAVTGTRARWIMIPASVVADNGTYYIIPASDTTKCLEIASGSKANQAKVTVNKRKSTVNYQTFTVSVNAENYSVKLINQNSNKAIDIWAKSNNPNVPDKVGQYTQQSASTSQRFFIVRSGSVTINKVKYPTYTIRSEKSEFMSYYLTVSGSTIKMATLSSGSASQRFAFLPTEFLDNGLTVPGKISKTSFTTNGPGSVTVTGLSFSSKYTKFQVRYRLKKYFTGRKKYKLTTWNNINGTGTTNNGWGAAGTYSFTLSKAASNGVVTIPDAKFKNRTFTLKKPVSSTDETNVVAIDLIMEVRAFADVTKNGTTFRNARSTQQQTVIKIRQKPTIAAKSVSLIMDAANESNAADDKIGVGVTLEDSLLEGFSSVRARLIGADSIPISDWVSGTTKTINFYAGEKLYRLPDQNEKIGIQYSVVTTTDKIRREGTIKKTFEYSTSSSIQVGYARSTDGSLTAIIKAPRHNADCCFMEVDFLSGKKLIPCSYRGVYSGDIQWIAVPPLNKDTRIIVYSQNKNSKVVMFGETTIRVESHTSIWNWGSAPHARPTQFATLIVNQDNPPQQKRSYTSDLQFHNPAGRLLPVAFSSKALTIDLSITGLSIDSDAEYVSAGPMPPHNGVEYLVLLAELAGKGIHPFYRTPYGDWYQVGVSVVDVSKNALNYSDVSITQRALED